MHNGYCGSQSHLCRASPPDRPVKTEWSLPLIQGFGGWGRHSLRWPGANEICFPYQSFNLSEINSRSNWSIWTIRRKKCQYLIMRCRRKTRLSSFFSWNGYIETLFQTQNVRGRLMLGGFEKIITVSFRTTCQSSKGAKFQFRPVE
jgi:hypothetical protein